MACSDSDAELLAVFAVLNALNAFENGMGWSDWHHFETIHTRTEALLDIPTPDPLIPIWIRYWIEAQDPVGDSESLRPLDSGGLIVW